MRIRSVVRRFRPDNWLPSLLLPVAQLFSRLTIPFPITTVRRESLSASELRVQGADLATTHRVRSVFDRGIDVIPHFKDSTKRIRDAYFLFSGASRGKKTLPPGIDWLLDNYHIIQQVQRDLKVDLSPGFYRRLPKLKRGEYRHYPRVLELAAEYLALTDSRFDRERFTQFMIGYQSDKSLAVGELWALPIFLRLVLLEHLRLIVERWSLEHAEQLKLDAIINRFAMTMGGTELAMALATALEGTTFNPSMLLRLIRTLRVRGPKAALAIGFAEEKLREQGMTFEDLTRQVNATGAADQVTMMNVFVSFKSLASLNWKKWVEDNSQLHAELSKDADYVRSDFETRNIYRSRIEQLATRSERTELGVAKSVLELSCSEAALKNINKAARHIGYYLIDKGYGSLIKIVGYRAPIRERILSMVERNRSGFYFGLIGAVTISLSLLATQAVWLATSAVIPSIIAFLCMALVGSEFGTHLTQWLTLRFFPAKQLAKFDFSKGIPEEFRSVVVVHTLLSDKQTVERMVEGIEIRYLGNRDANLTFCLLGDLPDAAAEKMPGDAELLEFTTDAMRKLATRCPQGKFAALTRQRRWNDGEGKWMAWERKRGKLEEFHRLIRGNDGTSFLPLFGDPKKMRMSPFVITLDLDTQLPRGAAARLVGTLAHPLNRPVLDDARSRVMRGYSVIQPRVGVHISSGSATPFSRLFAGNSGIDPYTQCVSDLYQDVFGAASYIGKGIIDVDAFSTLLDENVPDNTILSHDLFEGERGRTGLASDVELFDDIPGKYHAFARRQHRWIRGDWQLLPWLLPKVPSGNGYVANPFSSLSRWKLFDNLRRSLVAVGYVGLFVLISLSLSAHTNWWTVLLLFFLAFPLFSNLASGLAGSSPRISFGTHLKGIGRDAGRHLGQTIVALLVLPHQAIVTLDAVFRTLWRLRVSRKRLLEWETADQADKRLGDSFLGIFREMALGWGLTVLLAAVVVQASSAFTLTSLVIALWLVAPVVIWRLSRVSPPPALSNRETEEITKLARETWKFFEEQLTDGNNYLIPDNVQFVPKEIVAKRTSPTNISLSMLAVVAASDMKFIPVERSIELLAKISESLERLERFRGHFLNWYAIDRMAPLLPRYVSFVDSGNLVGHFITLRSTIKEFRANYPDLIQSHGGLMQQIDGRLERWIAEMEFGFLYDEERKLFAIGYNVDNATRDPNCYDLLASEARLGSFVAIAREQVGEEHWFSLGRTITSCAGGKALLSWSGTAFEYLMPLLVMRSYPGSLLDRTYTAIVKAQQAYGEKLNVPWGVSESAYSGVDFERTYQYHAFGVPGLGFKRGLSHDLVISPYSTVLALQVDPSAAVKNFAALDAEGYRGRYGFYEAGDYTGRRLTPDEKVHIVQSFFSHHQGMSFVAMANVLCDSVFQRRFHTDASVRATELLLQERFPRTFETLTPNQAEQRDDSAQGQGEGSRISWDLAKLISPHTTFPYTHVLSNGNFSVMIDNAGAGYSWIGDVSLTRWREDEVACNYGEFVFVRDRESEEFWSTTYQPVKSEPDAYEVIFSPDKAEFKRRDFDIHTHTDIVVSPEDNVQVRRVSVKNVTDFARSLDLTSYSEVVLNKAKAEAVHPAFSNIFIQTEYLADLDAILCERRPRSAHEKPTYFFQLVNSAVVWAPLQYDSSRATFVGRGRTSANPIALESEKLAQSVGAVLEPIVAMRIVVELGAKESHTVCFVSGYAATREEAIHLIERYHNSEQSVHRAFELAWAQSSVELRSGQVQSEEAAIFQRLASAIFFNHEQFRTAPENVARNGLTQSGLWRFGISGDIPIVLARISDPSQLPLIQQVLSAHDYLRLRGVKFDLTILNEYPGGYAQDLHHELEFMIRAGRSETLIEKSGGIFLRGAQAISSDEITLLEAVARVVLNGTHGSLVEQLLLPKLLPETQRYGGALGPASDGIEFSTPVPLPALQFRTKYGGFDPKTGEFVMRVHEGLRPPLPWSNVIASPEFGCLVTESGGGYTWSENSRENRLSTWSNDAVSDPMSEIVYLRDQDTGAFWSATPQPAPVGDYRVKHGFGYSSFESNVSDIRSEMTVRVHPSEPVKEISIEVTNHGRGVRQLGFVYFVEPVLGVLRTDSYRHLVSRFETSNQVLTVTNRYNNEFAGRSVFVGSSEPIASWTASREEFIGRHGDTNRPLALARAHTRGFRRTPFKLSGKSGACFNQALMVHVGIELDPGESKRVSFFLGESRSADQLAQLSARLKSVKFRADIEAGNQSLKNAISAVRVKTPDPAFDLMVNGWLMHQVISCRLWGRSGFYQSGGALGFRDQLQDSLALLIADPAACRAQIMLHASRQFIAGDVQHWWHPPTGRGVRTTISDDLLWLPYAVCEYLDVTGDERALEEEISFLEGQELPPGHSDLYFQPQVSARRGSLFEHCSLTLDRSLATGAHGLPLMGGGDWNDGMNEVGHGGKGESVWLGWFLVVTLERFAVLCDSRAPDKAKLYRDHAAKLRAALSNNAWDGEWYRRAFFDDGTPLGTASAAECKIDSLSQSWAVIANDPRGKQAMDSAIKHLVRPKSKIIKLLDPPFDKMVPTPGYIQGYVPGIRENGAQYTHAATWVVLAASILGDGDRAYALWNMLNPINHASSEQLVAQYQAEPYVLCGDVYAGELEGRAGWSWYSGSAGWQYRIAIENILGIKRRGDSLTVSPCVPKEWPGFEAWITINGKEQHIVWRKDAKVENRPSL